MTHSLAQACIDAYRIRVSELVSIRRYSRVYRCETDNGTLAVKVCLEGTRSQPDPATATLEYSSMQMLASQARTAGEMRLCPDAIGLDKVNATIAMTWEPGTELTGLLLSGNTNARAGLELGKVAGDWLKRFHRLGNRPETSNDLPEKIPFLRIVVAALSRRHRIMTKCFRKIEVTAPRAGMIPLPVSWALGDFKSDNLLVNGRGAVGIDILIREENSVIYNIAQFLVHLDLLRWTPRGLLRRPVLDAAAKGFLSAYLSETEGWNLPIVWLRTIMLFQRVIDVAAATGLKGRLRRFVALRALARSCKDLDPYL